MSVTQCHCTKSFPLRFSSINVTKSEIADLVAFTEEILNGKLHFSCSVYRNRKFELDGKGDFCKEQGEISVKQITTDRHIQIKKIHERGKAKAIISIIFWYVSKNIKQKIRKSSKKKSGYILAKRLESICEYLWAICDQKNGSYLTVKVSRFHKK